MPAEWELHAATIVAWPGRPSVWEAHLAQGQSETLALIAQVAKDEPVLVAASPAHYTHMSRQVETLGVSMARIDLDDCWSRDISPLFIFEGPTEQLRAVDFAFNAWGKKFVPHANDAAFGRAISERLQISYESIDLILEGGSITTDGQGTAIIVEATVLNPNRNPGLSKAVVESALATALGLETVIWLPHGLLGDTDTDGHVDNVAAFCAEGRVLVQMAPSMTHPDNERLAANADVLSRARDAKGRQLDLVEVPWLPVSNLDPSRPCSYINAYPTNASIIIPSVGAPTDRQVAEIIAAAFNGRTPVLLPADALSFGGGGPHCMTMQVPARTPSPQQGEDRDAQ